MIGSVAMLLLLCDGFSAETSDRLGETGAVVLRRDLLLRAYGSDETPPGHDTE